MECSPRSPFSYGPSYHNYDESDVNYRRESGQKYEVFSQGDEGETKYEEDEKHAKYYEADGKYEADFKDYDETCINLHQEQNNSGPVDTSNYAFRAVLFTLGPSQLVGCAVIIKSVVSSIFTALRIALNCTGYTLAAAGKLVFTKERQQDKLNSFINNIFYPNIYNHFATLKENAHCIVSSSLSMVPLIGLFAAGIYSSYMVSDSLQSKGFGARCAEAVTQHTLAPFVSMIPVIRSLVLKRVYPNTGTTINDYVKAKVQLSEGEIKERFGVLLHQIPEIPEHAIEDFRLEKFEDRVKEIGGQYRLLEVERGDGRGHHITCHHIVLNGNFAAQTMVLFHGNGIIGEEMIETAKFYKAQGLNVLMVTVGGYPGSDEGLQTTEMTTIQDVHAALRCLEGEGVQQIGVHGLSLGGSLASHAMLLSDKVDVAILDQTFDNIRNCVANNVNNSTEESPIMRALFPPAIVKGLVGASFPVGRMVNGVKKPGGFDYFTDGLNNKRKVRLFNHPLVCVGGNQDKIMAYNKENGRYSNNFAIDLAAAHEAENPFPYTGVYIKGGAAHGSLVSEGGLYKIQAALNQAEFGLPMINSYES